MAVWGTGMCLTGHLMGGRGRCSSPVSTALGHFFSLLLCAHGVSAISTARSRTCTAAHYRALWLAFCPPHHHHRTSNSTKIRWLIWCSTRRVVVVLIVGSLRYGGPSFPALNPYRRRGEPQLEKGYHSKGNSVTIFSLFSAWEAF